MPPSKRAPSAGKGITPRVKVWLELDGRYVFGHGISQILKAVERSGSIKAAAESLGKSYRYVWERVKKAERALGELLVETRVGGKGTDRSSLTHRAERLVADFDSLRRRMFDVAEGEFSARFGAPGRGKPARA